SNATCENRCWDKAGCNGDGGECQRNLDRCDSVCPGEGGGEGPPSDTCGPLEFPSGVKLLTTPDTAMTAEYAALDATCAAPKCFLDLNNLKDTNGNQLSLAGALKIKLSEHFTIDDFVGSETKVLISPKLVQLMEKVRALHGNSDVPITSAYRSPPHQ